MNGVPHVVHVIMIYSEPLFCKGFAQYFERTTGIAKPITLSNPYLLEETFKKAPCHVLVLDDEAGGRQGDLWVKELHKKYPEVKKIALTKSEEPLYLMRLQKNGCAGLVHKSTEGFEIKTGIFKVMEGMHYTCPTISFAIHKKLAEKEEEKDPGLAPREEQAMICMLQKMNVNEMMTEMGLKKPTIKDYRSIVINKIAAAGYKDIKDYGRKKGLIK